MIALIISILYIFITVVCAWDIFSLQKSIKEKFRKKLLKICKKEQIYLEFFDTIESLNEVNKKTNLTIEEFGKLAIGTYSHFSKKDNSIFNRVKFKMPKIKLLLKKDDVWTLAHELGHHFSIKEFNDCSEKSAKRYIKTLAKQCMTKFERFLIKIELSVYSMNFK